MIPKGFLRELKQKRISLRGSMTLVEQIYNPSLLVRLDASLVEQVCCV